MAVGELTCENCGVGYGPDDIFCENCGYDFITGSLPGPAELYPPPEPSSSVPPAADPPTPAVGDGGDEGPPPAAIPTPDIGAVATGERLRFVISPDRSYFEAVVSEGELDYPDPPPNSSDLELTGDELHIGRTSESRAIHPDLDISDLTGDPAVSSRHAVIRVHDGARVTVTDVGSTNGTFVGDVNSKAIVVGESIDVPAGTPVFVGAWTRIEIQPVAP